MTKIPKLKPILLLITCFLFLVANLASGAELFLQTEKQTFGIGESFKVDLFLESPQESINAIEGKIIFSGDLLELKEIRDGNSIINFWIERPKNNGNQIIFSGIIPGGYNDSKGLIFSITFLAKKGGGGAIEFSGVKALRNDGKGTLAKTAIFNFQFSILESAPGIEPQIPSSINDRDPPEDFKPEIAQNTEMFNGQWFLVFATQDKNSGIDHYEILETSNKQQSTSNKGWIVAESPYVLQDQKLRSFIYVKAVDKAGNEKIETFLPKYPLRWYEQPLIWSIIILGIIIVYLIRFKIKNAKRKSAI